MENNFIVCEKSEESYGFQTKLGINIVIEPKTHNNKEVLFLRFAYDDVLINKIKNLVGSHWSKTNCAWYVPDNTQYRMQFNLPPKPKAEQDIDNICEANRQALNDYIKLLEQKAYSPNTIKTYTSEIVIYFKTLKTKVASELSSERINDYFHYCISKLGLSENQIHSRINAVKFYYEQVLGRSKIELQIIRPKKAKQLPRVMSFEDVQKLLDQVKNNKHYFMLALTYGTGMRLSEIVNLKLMDIDTNRATVFIRRAKGKKDRVVSFPKTLLQLYKLYKLEFQPKVYVLEGQYGGQYSAKSVQEVFQTAKKKAGLDNIKGIHSFRHSYATHLHEMGTDISSIQKLLGHNDIKTTMIYTHISQKEMQNVISPLDQLIRNKQP
jgi:integrase/recombinase XerD